MADRGGPGALCAVEDTVKGLRLASHIHTTWSDDGSWDLPRIRRWLKLQRYEGALVCDHDRTMTQSRWDALVDECRRLSDDRFVLIPGVEYQDADHVVHVPVYGAMRFQGRSPDISTLLDSVAADGAAAVIAHPARREAWRRFDPAWTSRLAGIEVWSRKYDGVEPNHWALDTAAIHGLPAYVALDFHGPRQFYPLSMVVDCPPDERAIVGALARREVRARSLGVDLSRFSDGRLAGATARLEDMRRRWAPRIRRAEAYVRSNRAG